jgi:hypothetical protein
MFGYKKIEWYKEYNEWKSPDRVYTISKIDTLGYVVGKNNFVIENGYKVFNDIVSCRITTTLAKAKKWCNEECEKDYLHFLQLEINQTNRYGS